jgi:hypothetical protein
MGPTTPLASIENRIRPNPMNHAPQPPYKYSPKFFTLFTFLSLLLQKSLPTKVVTSSGITIQSSVQQPQFTSPAAEHDR